MTNRIHSLTTSLKPHTLSLAIFLTLFSHASIYADSSYGPIGPGETLSKIVKERYPASQYPDTVIMREIFRLNSGSFIADNVGLLKSGVTLVLPDEESLRKSLLEQGISSSSVGAVNSIPAVSVESASLTDSIDSGRNRLATVQDSLRLVQQEQDDLRSTLLEAQNQLSEVKVSLGAEQNKPLNILDIKLSEAQAELHNLKIKYESTVSELTLKLKSTLSIEKNLRSQLSISNEALEKYSNQASITTGNIKHHNNSIGSAFQDGFTLDSGYKFLTNPIVLPTWSALAALLAVALTALIALVGRRNKSSSEEPVVADDEVVFKSGNLDAFDDYNHEDVEALRVAPRRDPSRVAIIDPSMTGELTTTPSVKKSISKKTASSSSQSVNDSNDADLKLAMAEAYMELSDILAANELLHEVLLEGNAQQQQTSAELLMS